ncbi:MAG TPA: hypothetical protein VD968_20265 [Pyrinomonadaceae bacterium]|nr:hypothetical protein [Pyrinomonadaceae bacterium]
MKAKRLKEVISDDGIRWVNFFNGRLLSGEDLSSEQGANRKGLRRLGRAVGSGVAYGLEVSAAPGVNSLETPLVSVRPGLAVNGEGQTLSLKGEAIVSLTRPSNAAAEHGLTGDVFDDCTPLQAGTYLASAGIYLLTIAPARQSEGRAPVSGLDNITARCNTRYNVEGVQFRLLQIDVSAAVLSDAARLRNRVAYLCFGAGDAARPSLRSDLFDSPPPAGLLDSLRPGLLTDCDVPLAIINWTTTGGIVFVDNWAVRRRIAAHPAEGHAGALIGDEAKAAAEARFLQFQEQLEWMGEKEPNVSAVIASQRFDFLPPAGVLPLAGGAQQAGFMRLKFFEGLTVRAPVFIEGARVEQVLRQSLSYAPVSLGTREMLWLYEVRENAQDIADRVALRPARPYMIFTTGHMPFYGEARFDLSRWNYSNYSSLFD